MIHVLEFVGGIVIGQMLFWFVAKPLIDKYVKKDDEYDYDHYFDEIADHRTEPFTESEYAKRLRKQIIQDAPRAKGIYDSQGNLIFPAPDTYIDQEGDVNG